MSLYVFILFFFWFKPLFEIGENVLLWFVWQNILHPIVTASLKRLFLHAYKLEFTTPSGKALTLETDLPEELQSVIDELEKVRYNS